MPEMDKKDNSVMVLQIWLEFWWMIPMGVKYNHTKFGQETQWWQPGTGVASGKPRFQNLSKIARKMPFFGRFGCYDVRGGGGGALEPT